MDAEFAPIPSLLATPFDRSQSSDPRKNQESGGFLIVESGEPLEIMHFALLRYGASAVNPYLAIETLEDLHRQKAFPPEYTWDKVFKNYMKALDKGLLRNIFKMGISTLQVIRAPRYSKPSA